MPWHYLSRLDDPQLDVYRDLKRSNLTRRYGSFIVEGQKLVERLLASPYPVESVLVATRFATAIRPKVPAETTVYELPDELLPQLVGFNFHRGVLACGRRIADAQLDALSPTAPNPTLITICDAVQNPENLGAILRLSAAFGATGVLLGPGCADPLSRRVLRVSMGFGLHLPIRTVNDLPSAIHQLNDNCPVWGTTLDTRAMALDSFCRPQRMALVMGNEGHGLNAAVSAACRGLLTIPMSGGVDSLNVAVCAGIFLHAIRLRNIVCELP